ncbi:MAG: T9SS type A sorting domain-containing protein [Bacteroidales bacterium]|nr:T9SS type A sorting domain-containing protein [Bacteroidales bacterium]
MKKYLHFFGGIVVLCLFVFNNANAQVMYGYDDSGNRISRIILRPILTPPPQDSTEYPIEEQENPVAFVQDTENGDEKSQEVYTDALSKTPITIYPNPTSGLLTIKISEVPQHSVSNLTLFDMHGRIIIQEQPLSNENNLDIGAQPSGMYIMQITVGEEVTSWKIIKSEL